MVLQGNLEEVALPDLRDEFELAPGDAAGLVRDREGRVESELHLAAELLRGSLTTDGVIEALEGIHDLDLGLGTKLSYGLSEHQASHKVWGTILDEAAQYQVLDLE